MAPEPEPPPLRPRQTASFTPRFTLSLLYLFGFFFLYCFVLIAPTLFELLRTMPPGPEQEAAAERAAQAVVQPRLWIALGASLATVGLGAWAQVLPGLRR